MEAKKITDSVSVSAQITPADVAAIAQLGFRSIIDNRPDGEANDQAVYAEIEQAAQQSGIESRYMPVTVGKISDSDAQAFGRATQELPKPILAYCRTGTRSATLWALDQATHDVAVPDILMRAKGAGYDLTAVARRIANGGKIPNNVADAQHDIVIIGGGSAGIAVAASLLLRKSDLDVAIIDPADVHYYQPGWTLVGAGVFRPEQTAKTMGALIPKGVHWIKAAVSAFEPKSNVVVLDGCRVVKYKRLIVAPGLKLDWHAIDGLVDTLGRNGVTSNYRYDLAPYTWQQVQKLKTGRALFTQPPMPIKCAGAPQKVLYLSADYWHREDYLADIDIQFYSAGGVLFGVEDYVPALMEYVEKYQANLKFNHNLVKVDGHHKRAWFTSIDAEGKSQTIETEFDMLHVCPPQTAPDFIRVSPLADQAGWVDVDKHTLRHKTFENIWSLGDVMNAPNAKTAAAARKQAPVVAANLLTDMGIGNGVSHYDGYGSCPLTVERGKIVLAEFGYGGKLLPTLPNWLINGKKPSRLAWLLKEKLLPPVYWQAMLRGREWLAKPEIAN